MKKIIVLVFAFFIYASSSFAQPAKKTTTKEKAPTQKEMADLMKEMQKELDGMSPEDKKMMDSMGVKMPDAKQIKKNTAGISDKQLADAWEDENRIVPKRDETRIAAVSKTPLTGSSVSSFVNTIHNKATGLLLPESKTLGEKIYGQLKTEGYTAADIGNTAAGLWMTGHIQPAIYILGRACTEDITNTDNLNNYASILSMCGAEQMAIPVLNYLNSKFPGNSTVLNNLGQAWFGLGELTKAEKYFDSTIRIYAYHPQACLSKSLIEESKGNKTEAINLVKKSIQHSYSKEKEERLRKLGYKPTGKDFTLPAKTKADPLNLGGSTHPAFPKSVEECIVMEPEWENFREQLKSKAATLTDKLKDAWKITTDMYQKRTDENMRMVKASINSGSPQGVLTLVPIYADKSYQKQKELTDDYGRKINEWSKKSAAFFSGRGLTLTREYEAEIEKLQEEDLEQTGEGLPNKDFCPRYKAASDKYLGAYNSETEALFNEHLELVKNYLNEMTYLQMYSEWPEKFEAHKLEAQIAWLGALSAEPPANFISITKYKCAKTVPSKPGKLAEFDDVACQYHSELNFIAFKMQSDCSRMTTTIDAKFLKLKLKQDMDKETFADQFMGCTVAVKASVGIGDKIKLGPVEVGAKAEAGVEVEIDRTGITDVSLIGGIKVGAGIKNDEGKIKLGGAGAEVKISMVTGTISGKGNGIFKMIK
jgi:tetratricopeptide (TPR) repeat protein